MNDLKKIRGEGGGDGERNKENHSLLISLSFVLDENISSDDLYRTAEGNG